MISLRAALLSPFKRVDHRMRYWAHEKPVLFYSCILGAIGPVLAVAVPPIRRNYFGYVAPEQVPTSYPLPQRKRQPVTGYEDE